jgi:hypothetical protein
VAAIRHMALWRQLRDGRTALLLVTLALCLIRTRDQPGVDVTVGGTTATIVPADVALLALLVVTLAAFRVARPPRSTWLAIGGGVAFCVLVLVTAAANGSTSLVAGVKLVELAVLTLAALVLVRDAPRLEAVVDVLLLFTIAADVVGLVEFVRAGGGRQNSFLGEHDFAALGSLPLLYGLVLVASGRRTARAILSIVAGGIGCILGAALASLGGLYLGAAALVAVVVARGQRVVPTTVVTAAVVAAVTAGTLSIRSGELGFLQSWFGKPPSRPGQYAASWSQRLIFTYIDGRVFVDHPLLGTGWYPLLPPHEFDRYLPAARRRFSDQPANYFPDPAKPFIPQQSFDQIPAELGLVGVAAFLAFLVGTGSAAVRAARRSPLAAAWLASILGAIAGEALFGGTALVALAWLVPGVCLALAWAPEAAPA